MSRKPLKKHFTQNDFWHLQAFPTYTFWNQNFFSNVATELSPKRKNGKYNQAKPKVRWKWKRCQKRDDFDSRRCFVLFHQKYSSGQYKRDHSDLLKKVGSKSTACLFFLRTLVHITLKRSANNVIIMHFAWYLWSSHNTRQLKNLCDFFTATLLETKIVCTGYYKWNLQFLQPKQKTGRMWLYTFEDLVWERKLIISCHYINIFIGHRIQIRTVLHYGKKRNIQLKSK